MIILFKDFKILENDDDFSIEKILSLILSNDEKSQALGKFYNETYLNNYLYIPSFNELFKARFPWNYVEVGFINQVIKNLSDVFIPLNIFEKYYPENKNVIYEYYKRSREIAPNNFSYAFGKDKPFDISKYHNLIQYIISDCLGSENSDKNMFIEVEDFSKFDLNFNKVYLNNLTIKSKYIDLSLFNKDNYRNVKNLIIDCEVLVLKDYIDLSNLLFNGKCKITLKNQSSTIKTDSIVYKFSNSEITFVNSSRLNMKKPERYIIQELKKTYPNITFLNLTRDR